ncbi:MAG: alpha/beta fold hydrolase [Firmicutes bacterium]|nr:alpha/beta fold hydrolase [Bacillota bacterium]
MKKTNKRVKAAILVLTLLGLLAILFSAVCIIQNKMLFHPFRNMQAEEYMMQNGFEKTEIQNGKYTCVGWLHRCDESRKTLVYFGGNSQISALNMQNWDINECWKYFADYNVLSVDYPGYGESGGSPSEKSIFETVNSVMRYVGADETLNEKIVVMGFSLGTGAAVYASANYEVSGLILAAPYDEMASAYNNFVDIFHGAAKKLIIYPFKSYKYAKDVKAQTLIFASKDDEVIPYESSERLSKNFSDAELFTASGLRHNEILWNEEVVKKINLFLKKC